MIIRVIIVITLISIIMVALVIILIQYTGIIAYTTILLIYHNTIPLYLIECATVI